MEKSPLHFQAFKKQTLVSKASRNTSYPPGLLPGLGPAFSMLWIPSSSHYHPHLHPCHHHHHHHHQHFHPDHESHPHLWFSHRHIMAIVMFLSKGWGRHHSDAQSENCTRIKFSSRRERISNSVTHAIPRDLIHLHWSICACQSMQTTRPNLLCIIPSMQVSCS